MKSTSRMIAFSPAVLALALSGFLVGCNKSSTDSAAPAGSATGASAAASGSVCDVAAFEKEQDEKGRQSHTPRKLTGCKLESYSPKSKTAQFSGNGKMKLSCVNIPNPEGMQVGDLADIEGKEDGAGFVTLYDCTVKKK
ncbi:MULTISPECIES: hypothetical protein [Polyangium]|uniref:DUF5666 domain-containing protein n=2 Tax=Polyangium TaxID=55 RepID=A0A4U1JIE9_9BACT|nr:MULTISPECIES: hypothetical protein [Polyangium]MDI1429076.1 hypothetical protein [Polyangium sorediatum]TKD12274.1 hypothetical protein E8A74_03975 [Polyangium fumosum]